MRARHGRSNAILRAFLASIVPLLLLDPRPARGDEAALESNRLYLWRVTPKVGKNVAYLLGSIHAGTEDMYPLPDEIEAAFDECAVLAVEVDLASRDQEALQTFLAENGVYLDGDTLARHLPRATYDKFRRYCAGTGLPDLLTDRLRPWAATVLVTALEVQKLGLKAELGIDRHFIDRANEGEGRRKKTVVELETARQQLDLLAGFPDRQQAEFLDATLEGAGRTKQFMEQLVAAWKAGDADAMQRLTVTDAVKKRPALKPVFQKLVDERNVTMARTIEGYLKGRQKHFVVVGAGHLAGRTGIPALLAKKGYRVEQVRRAKARAEVGPAGGVIQSKP